VLVLVLDLILDDRWTGIEDEDEDGEEHENEKE
jgi:hypothetical protein